MIHDKRVPSRELTYPQKWHFEDDFPFPKVGYVNSQEGTSGTQIPILWLTIVIECVKWSS